MNQVPGEEAAANSIPVEFFRAFSHQVASMNTLAKRPPRGLASDELVSRDSDLLALHMQECKRSRSRFFRLQSDLELAYAIVTPRIVTSIAVALILGTGILFFV
ncbi:MAG TPA: hypothetical protein VLJ57_10820 [Burkholderiaceae bacterium]|nr:hypothetical protein [Burkholderiaceae bacterium]